MNVSIFHIIALVLVVMLIANVFKPFKKQKQENGEIVGHTKPEPQAKSKAKAEAKPQAVPMDCMTIAPAFAEATDWSAYDQPTFLRNKRGEEADVKEEAPAKAKAPVEAKPANRKPATQAKATPQQQMQAFKANANSRRNTKASFEEI